MKDMINVQKILKREPKGSFEQSRHRWEDNIKLNLRKIGWEGYRLDSSSSRWTSVGIL